MNDHKDVDGFDESPSRYIVGIDLGTTNCAVAYVDTTQTNSPIQIFLIEQWVDFGTREPRELLPSFVYQPTREEAQSLGELTESQQPQIVGVLARDRGLQLPGRQISSAKSWLCHDGVDRRGPILPWQSDEGVDQLSPVEASAKLLAHIRLSFDKEHPADRLADQDLVLTLPASFDQVARQLTIEAAEKAGLRRVLPIEEPQAAFYAWLARHSTTWEELVTPGQTILVCDIGGGTTDFTLIRVRHAVEPASPHTGKPSHGEVDLLASSALESSTRPEAAQCQSTPRCALHRVAVGQHLILGGDNIDLALAKLAEFKLTGGKTLAPRVWDALRQACRVAKETLLGDGAPPSTTLHLPGTGSRLIGGGSQVEVTLEEVHACVLDGFFPKCGLREQTQTEQTGFQEFGLPYASDPAITKHLAQFLWEHRFVGRNEGEVESLSDCMAARPDWILFNGGVMTSAPICDRIVSVVASWFANQDGISADWMPQVLDGERLDLAVAKGAAYFGQVRRGTGVQIEATLACSYYLQTSVEPPLAICIVPGSASAGDQFRLSNKPFELTIGQPVQFPIVYSTTRLADKLGEVVEIDREHFAFLPPIRTVIELSGRRRQESLPVVIEVELTQIGTLQIYCQASDTEHRWKLEFDVRGSTQSGFSADRVSANPAPILDETLADTARKILSAVFREGTLKPSRLMGTLADEMGIRKNHWPPSLLRAMWSALIDWESGRRKSAEHEARWLNLLGYSLRPGYGLAADDWRVAQTWRLIHGKLAFASVSSRNESLILWRRISGGFTAGQQLTVYQQIAGPLRAAIDPERRAKGGGGTQQTELVELLRLVGSLELLPSREKLQIGAWLLELLQSKKWSPMHAACLWTIGRLGSRQPTYGPLNSVIEVREVSLWLEKLLRLPNDDSNYALALMLCGRRVGDRYRDIEATLREEVESGLARASAPEHYRVLVGQGGELEGEEASQILGESLPLGLTTMR